MSFIQCKYSNGILLDVLWPCIINQITIVLQIAGRTIRPSGQHNKSMFRTNMMITDRQVKPFTEMFFKVFFLERKMVISFSGMFCLHCVSMPFGSPCLCPDIFNDHYPTFSFCLYTHVFMCVCVQYFLNLHNTRKGHMKKIGKEHGISLSLSLPHFTLSLQIFFDM